MSSKYSKEALSEAVRRSDSVYGVIRFLGGNPGSGGTYQWVRRKIQEHSLDTSHFLGLAYNKGRSPSNKKSPVEVLVNDPFLRTRKKAATLRCALKETGRKMQCVGCGLDSWRGKKLRLQVDHIDGNWRNNVETNLQMLCPNCHSQK